jgi:hypothetical protein
MVLCSRKWHNSDILRGMTFLEMLPIALAICVWHREFHKKKILFHVDNMAVVSILNYMSTKSDRVLKVMRFIVYRSLIGNFHLKAKYINTAFNSIADALSRLSRAQFQKFKELAPHADSSPTMVPYEFLIFLMDNIKV